MSRTFVILRTLAGLSFVAALILLSLLPAREMIRTGAPKGFEHFLAYFLTALIATFGMKPGSRVAMVVSLVTLAGAMEALQFFAPGRTPFVSDFLASSAGALAGATVAVGVFGILSWRPSAR